MIMTKVFEHLTPLPRMFLIFLLSLENSGSQSFNIWLECPFLQALFSAHLNPPSPHTQRRKSPLNFLFMYLCSRTDSSLSKLYYNCPSLHLSPPKVYGPLVRRGSILFPYLSHCLYMEGNTVYDSW